MLQKLSEECLVRMHNIYNKSLHRKYLETLIRKRSHKAIGTVLEIGSKNRRYDNCLRNATKIVAIDLIGNFDMNVIPADAKYLPFKKNSFDSVISFEVFEYVYELDMVLNEVERVITGRGFFLFSVPFLNPVHGNARVENEGTDILRLTNKGWFKLLKPHFSEVHIHPFGGRWSLIYDFWFDWVRKSGKVIKLFALPFCLIIERLVTFLDKVENNKRFVMGYFIVCNPKER